MRQEFKTGQEIVNLNAPAITALFVRQSEKQGKVYISYLTKPEHYVQDPAMPHGWDEVNKNDFAQMPFGPKMLTNISDRMHHFMNFVFSKKPQNLGVLLRGWFFDAEIDLSFQGKESHYFVSFGGPLNPAIVFTHDMETKEVYHQYYAKGKYHKQITDSQKS